MIFFSSIIFPRLPRTCLHGGGGPQIGEVTCGGSPHLSCKYDQINMRDYMDRRVTPPERATIPAWGPPPPCKQAPKEHDARKVMIHVKHAKIITFVEDKLTIAVERTCKVHRTKQNRLGRTYLHILTNDLFSRQLYVWLDNSRTVTFI